MSVNCAFQIEQVANNLYRATSTLFPDLEGEGETTDEACRALNEAIECHLRHELGEDEPEAIDFCI